MFTEWELRKIDESLFVAIGSPVGDRLRHQEHIELVAVERVLHQLNRLQYRRWVEMAIYSNDIGTWRNIIRNAELDERRLFKLIRRLH